ncbi:hypothetical protein Metbo_1106 [Methanobacterium lacus]|uniref:Uncharacterized protein n=1 Tax=Methanobacterium lacus (strain AL-21) TaxID=877455 RepID=F0T5V8_METLA|nr:hypothetical protein [Methanobacterium lacus]ADZ09351.1 hypothetical protein Metbo_1106 [Methanobacterium lacus]
MPRMSSVYLNIDGLEITEVTRHYYPIGKPHFKFNRNSSNDRIYTHLKSKEGKRMKLIYNDENGIKKADSLFILSSITCKDDVITVNMER